MRRVEVRERPVLELAGIPYAAVSALYRYLGREREQPRAQMVRTFPRGRDKAPSSVSRPTIAIDASWTSIRLTLWLTVRFVETVSPHTLGSRIGAPKPALKRVRKTTTEIGTPIKTGGEGRIRTAETL